MSSATRCRAKGGVAFCTDPNCPEKRAGFAGVAAAFDKNERAQRRSFLSSLGAFFGGRREAEPVGSATGLHVSTVSQAEMERLFAVSAAKPVKKPVTRGVLDVVSQREDGRFEVLAKDGVSEGGQDVYPFGDYITDAAVAQRLHDADPGMVYQNGECGGLAAELWNRNPHVKEFYIFSCVEDRVFGTHQFVQLTDGTFADSLGVWSESALVEHWRTIDEDVRLEVFDDGEPIPDKDPNIEVSNQKLFDAITDVIEAHFRK